METERSIVLQKKMILFLSFMIVAIFSIVVIRENRKDLYEGYANKVGSFNLVTVNESIGENEIIRENIKFLAVSVINREEKNSGEKILSEDLLENKANEDVLPSVSTSGEIKVVEEKPKVEKVIQDKTKYVKYRDLAEDNPPEEYKSVIEASATAYCLCKKCCGKTPDNPYFGYTHSGIKIEQGSGIKVIAVDPNVIPLNSKVYVEGLNGAWDYGHAIAADTGSAIKELKIDLYMDTHEEALQWGRKKVRVYVLGE